MSNTHDRFARLQRRLADLWRSIEDGEGTPHTSIVVPSLTFDREELAKISGVAFYEERLLFALMRLRDPNARCIYVTSQPIHPAIVDYYLQWLSGVSPRNALGRLQMFCTYDARPLPLTRKILDRPRLVARIRDAIRDPSKAYLTCFNATELERRLALALDVPLNGVDPDLLHLGTKSGSRKLFRQAGIPMPDGTEDVRDEDSVVDALLGLANRHPGLTKAVIKLDESFAGAGNALFRFPEERGGKLTHDLPDEDAARRASIAGALPRVELATDQSYPDFARKLEAMGGIVEAFVAADEVRSPSVQMRITPTGDIEVVSTHDQVLGGPMGQSYIGCRFPCHEDYRGPLMEAGIRLAEVMREHGVVSRFGIDFMALRDEGEDWRLFAIEINLRMGGTTPPFLALEFLTGGKLDRESGTYRTGKGRSRCYRATDSLASPAYRGLLPEDLIDILAAEGLEYRAESETGVLFHMIGALSEHGKVGVTCIGKNRRDADALFDQTVDALDRATADSALDPKRPSGAIRIAPRME